MMLNFDWLDVEVWLCGRWVLVVWTLELGCMDVELGWLDVGFWSVGC